MNNDSTYYFIILRFLPESRKENYTSQRCSVFEKRANNLLALTATGKHFWKGCVPPGKLPSSQILIAFLRSFSREKNISIYIYFPRCPSASPFFETIPRSKYEIDEANVKKGKIRRRSENKRRKEKDRIGRRKARGAGK